MLKEDYIVRMVQEITAALVNEIMKRHKMKHTEWEEYDHLSTQILGCTTQELLESNAESLIAQYGNTKEGYEKIELIALYMVKLADDMKGKSIVNRAKYYQEALKLLVYLQQNGNTYSLTRLEIIQMLKREGY